MHDDILSHLQRSQMGQGGGNMFGKIIADFNSNELNLTYKYM